MFVHQHVSVVIEGNEKTEREDAIISSVACDDNEYFPSARGYHMQTVHVVSFCHGDAINDRFFAMTLHRRAEIVDETEHQVRDDGSTYRFYRAYVQYVYFHFSRN